MGHSYSPIQFLILGVTVAVMCGILFIARWLGARRFRRELASRPAGRNVIVEMPLKLMPMERGSKFEEPLDKILQGRRLGTVDGGGTQMDSQGGIDWIDIDVFLYEASFNDGLELTINTLLELGAPPNSRLEYYVGEKKILRALGKDSSPFA